MGLIGQASIGDIPCIESLMKSVPGFWREDWRRDALAVGLRTADELALVYEEDERIVGFICAHDLGFRAYLSELVVASEHRGRGIARRLLETVEDMLSRRGCGVLVSDVWKDAEGFYRAMGWSMPEVVLLRKRLPAIGG